MQHRCPRRPQLESRYNVKHQTHKRVITSPKQTTLELIFQCHYIYHNILYFENVEFKRKGRGPNVDKMFPHIQLGFKHTGTMSNT